MGSLFEESLSWFAKMMEKSASSGNLAELTNHALQTNQPRLSIKSDTVDIKVFFSDDASSCSVVSHPDVPKDAIKVTLKSLSDTIEITIEEDLSALKNHNAAVIFHLKGTFDALAIESKSGDIALNGCRSRETFIISSSGDIVVNNHIVPCQTEAASENGDITRVDFVSMPSANKLYCKTTNGDIVLTNG